jgi:WD40 repeat protein
MTDSTGNGRRPDPARIQDTREFGAALTVLREQAGLSVRQVAQAIGAPRTTVGDYFSGRSVPGAATSWVLPELLARCGVTEADTIESWRQALVRVRRAPGPARAGSPSPYRGLAAFQPEDSAWFHGRDELVGTVAGHIRARCTTGGMLFVIGQSGAGKSSLLRAGVIPSLAETNGNIWHWRLLTPQATPLGQLARQLASGESAEELESRLRVNPESARNAAELLTKPLGSTHRLLVVVDQFEELFTEHVTQPDRLAFIEALSALAAQGSPATVVLGMRSDFYDHAVRYAVLAEALQDRTVVVGPMSEEEVRAAIVRPAQRAGVELEEGLVELLLRDFRPANDIHDSGSLPLLSHVLLATWQSSNKRRLTSAGYRATGGVAGAVEQSADAAYLSLTESQQRLARSLFLRLVQIGDGSVDTRRTVARSELPYENDSELAEVVDRFVAQRLITIDADTMQMSHEALVHAWSRLRQWLDADRDGLRLHRKMRAAATSWHESGRDPGGLYRGVLLEAAEAWAAGDHDADLNEVEEAFLAASVADRARQQRERRRQVRRLRRWIAALVVAVMIATGLVVVVFELRTDAVNDRNLAVSRHTALLSATLRSTDPALAAQLALAAYRIAPTPDARSSLLDAGSGPMISRARGSNGTIATALSPDGRMLATGGADGTARLWHVNDQGRLDPAGVAFPGSAGSVFGAAINSSGRVLALAGMDRAVRLWDIADPVRPQPLPDLQPALPGTGYATAFSSDGRYLAVSGQGGLRVWAMDAAGIPRTLVLSADLNGDGKAVSFSPDSRLLAAGGLGRRVSLWRLDGAEPSPLDAPVHDLPGDVNGLAFGPDGQTLAIACSDHGVYLWDVGKPAPTGGPLPGFAGPVYSVGFSTDGKWLAAGGSDSSARVWEVASRRPLPVLAHPGPVTATVYQPGSGSLLTAAADGYARLWALPGGDITGAPGPISTVSFGPDGRTLAASATTRGPDGTVAWSDVSNLRGPVPIGQPVAPPAGANRFTGASALAPDGQILAVGSTDGSSTLWDVTDRGRPVLLGKPLTGPAAPVESLAFTADGRTLAIGSDDHRVYVWDVGTPARPRLLATLTDPENIVMGVAFNADSHLLAAASVDQHTYLWDTRDPAHPRLLRKLAGHTNYAYAVAFSPDNRTLAVGSADKTVSLWDIQDPADPRQIGPALTGPTNYVYSVAFTADQRLLAASSTDGTVWTWDLTSGQPQVFATLHAPSAVYALAISQDSQVVAGGTADGSVRLWNLNVEQAAASVCGVAGDSITEAEWRQYIPDLGYAAPCPGTGS